MPFFLKEKKSLAILTSLIFFQLILISIQIPLGEKETLFEKAVFSIFSPVQHAVIFILQKTGELWEGYFSLRNVRKQNEKITEEIFSLRQENSFLRNSLKRFQEEKEIQQNLQQFHEDVVPVQVIGLDFSNRYKSITINKGTRDGMQKDMIVLDKFGYLVGRVIAPISLKEARVQLITDNNSGVSVYSKENGVLGVLTGDGNGQCTFNYILATNEEIREGNQLVTSGYDSIFPRGIEVGEIVTISPTTSLFKRIKVKPYFQFKNLDQLAVIRKFYSAY